jgi:acetolactate synthase-1/2/3 large subunit
MRSGATAWAARIAAASGCAVMSEFYTERIERGAGRATVPRMPYAVAPALALLARFEHIVLVSAAPPVAFFAYPGKPGRLWNPATRFTTLCTHAHDAQAALQALGEAMGAPALKPTRAAAPAVAVPDGALTPDSIAAVLAAHMPENAIVVDEAISTGRGFDAVTREAAPHDWLTNMGGSIGFGLPVAVGAAIGAPGRRVIALEGDGSAMYTPQSLWTMARENLDVTVIVFANRVYQILRGEFAHVGAGEPGRRATDMLSIDRPTLDWVALSGSMGVPARRATCVSELAEALRDSVRERGPNLVEVVL